MFIYYFNLKKMKLVKIFLCCILATLGLQMSAQGDMMGPLPLDPAVRYGVLPNGLTYYIRHNEEPRELVNFYIAQKVGSVQEEENQRGLAHFLEHMAFNGAKHFPGDGQLIKYCESIGVKFGANLNAYTSTDETVYNIDDVPTTNPTNIDSCLYILLDWSNGLLLEESEINKERGVIHEEWRMRSSASMRIINRNLETLYPESRYGRRMPIGLMSVIDNFEPDFLRAYYKKWYRPDLQGIVIVGDINVDEVEAKVKSMFGEIPAAVNPAKYELYPVPDNNEPIYVVDKDKEQKQAVIQLMYKKEAMPREFRESVGLLIKNYMEHVVNHALNTRLDELSKKTDCPYIYAGVGSGTYLISKTCDSDELTIVPKSGQDTEAVRVAVQELTRLRQHGLTGGELYRAREEYLSKIEKVYNNRDKQKSRSYCQEYVRHFLEGDCAPGIEVEYQIANSVAPNLPLEMFNEMLGDYAMECDTNFVFLAMYPEKEGEVLPTAEEFKQAVLAGTNAETEAYVDNVKNEPLIQKLPKKGAIASETPADFGYTKMTLKNGVNIYYKQTDFNNSQVLLVGHSNGGTSLIDDKDWVNANLVNQVMNSCGWGNFTATELEKKLAGKQVTLSCTLGQMSENFSGSTTPKDIRTLFELLYLTFRPVKDDPESYESTMQMLRSSLENAEKVPMTAFRDSLTKTVYGDKLRAKNLKLADLEQADYAKIKQIYTERFQKHGVNDFDFFVTGAFDLDSLREMSVQYLGALPKVKGKRETWVDRDVNPLPGERVCRFNRAMETPQATLVEILAGEMPYSMKDDVTADALGSVLDQMLLKTIREEAGLAYSVSAGATMSKTDREEYLLQVYCPFQPAKCDSVFMLINEGFEDVAKNGVDEKKLNDFKQFTLKEYKDNQRNNGYWQGLITNKVIWGVDAQAGFEDAVKNVSSDDIRNLMQRFLSKRNRIKVAILPEDLSEKE